MLAGTAELAGSGTPRGGYVLIDTSPDGQDPDLVIVATGSEVQLAVAAATELVDEGIHARVVSMPCLEWFDAQPQEYRDGVLPPAVRARVAVEAGSPLSWWRVVGDHGRVVGIDHYGASADQATLFREFGITTAAVVAAARETVAAVQER